MKLLDSDILNTMKLNLDAREQVIRKAIREALSELSPPDLSDQIVVTYWAHAAHLSPAQVGREISYHMTSGARNPPEGSLLDQCTGRILDSVDFDDTGRIGIVRVGFPLKMLRREDGGLYSTDILHITAGEGVFGLVENIDIKLCHIAMSDDTLRLFPGPAYGAPGVRALTGFGDRVAFGTILKPCTGITPDEEADIVAEAAANPLFMFVKEDENHLPSAAFAPLRERLRLSLEAVRRVSDQRGGLGLIFAPHITSPPQHIADCVRICVDAGANGVMFSELFAGGITRMVRDMTRDLPCPPAIYAHNGGISARTRHIWREVLDLLCRLDGADFRQTAPVTSSEPLLRPFGLEWKNCEDALSMPLAGHPPTMMARAGGLDQGNIIANLLDVERGAGAANYLFLAGSAINGIKDSNGHYDPALGAEAMLQALRVYRDGVFAEATEDHVNQLKAYADANGLTALSAALRQRYALP
ncbi:MAG: RuBisCO large subunit C-terminal-like domain-containing protein [Armatimonadota bacterium]|nr:RuBisCO large subunit C-terminal-like domain-containing protein [Armatimonadota bacterium]